MVEGINKNLQTERNASWDEISRNNKIGDETYYGKYREQKGNGPMEVEIKKQIKVKNKKWKHLPDGLYRHMLLC